MKTRGGDEAVFQSLHRAREVYRSRLQENAAVDQLASLFAECAIAEAQPVVCALHRHHIREYFTHYQWTSLRTNKERHC